MKRLLLHTCCAPCLIVPLERFTDEGYEVTAAYINPNIHPVEEYNRRSDAFRDYAESRSIIVLVSPYDTEQWELIVGSVGGPYPLIKGSPRYESNLDLRRKRCRLCYKVRFEQVAQLAEEQGFDGIATTLTISPYQFTDIICEELEAACVRRKIEAVRIDFKKYYPEATQRSRALGMYRQNFCGCHFSRQEAELERQDRKQKD